MTRAGDDAVGVPPACGGRSDVGAPPACGGEEAALMTRVAPTETRRVDELRLLEAEAVHIIREVVAELELPVLLFSAGKDSIVLLRLAEKAFDRCRCHFQ